MEQIAAGLSLMGAAVREIEGGDVEIERPKKVATLPPTLPAGHPFDETNEGWRFITMRAKVGEIRTVIRLIETWDAAAERFCALVLV